MSGREWKPGDVGMSNYGRVFYTTHADGAWIYDDGSGKEGITKSDPTDLRPLVVIDPEDERAVASLVAALHWDTDPSDIPATWRAQAALRSLITPPKPEEPLGLGAVVEDAEGLRWLRHSGILAPWHRSDAAPSERAWRYWDDIAAVKILSEGVQ